MKLRSLPYLVQIGLLAAGYYAVGQLGYVLAMPQPGLRLIWPATGLALAALLLFGLRLWPGVTVGSFALTVTGIGSPGVAAGIALANTLQAVISQNTGNFSEAAVTYERILNQYPDFAPAQKQLAIIYAKDSSKLDKAFELATKARETMPDDLELTRILGMILVQKSG